MDQDFPKPPTVQQVAKVKSADSIKFQDGTFRISAAQTATIREKERFVAACAALREKELKVHAEIRRRMQPAWAAALLEKEPKAQAAALAAVDKREQRTLAVVSEKFQEAQAVLRKRLQESQAAALCEKRADENSSQNDTVIGTISSTVRVYPPLARGNVKLENISDEVLATFVRQLAKENPGFEAKLKDIFTKNSTSPALKLPDVAPMLWDDRGEKISAPNFIRKVYSTWLDAGILTGSCIKDLDPKLYNSYHVRVSRHPEDVIAFAESKPANFIADPQDAIDRRRASARETQAQARARARADILTHD